MFDHFAYPKVRSLFDALTKPFPLFLSARGVFRSVPFQTLTFILSSDPCTILWFIPVLSDSLPYLLANSLPPWCLQPCVPIVPMFCTEHYVPFYLITAPDQPSRSDQSTCSCPLARPVASSYYRGSFLPYLSSGPLYCFIRVLTISLHSTQTPFFSSSTLSLLLKFEVLE